MSFNDVISRNNFTETKQIVIRIMDISRDILGLYDNRKVTTVNMSVCQCS